MIWYIEVSNSAPKEFKGDKYLSIVMNTVTPYMEYFMERINFSNCGLEDVFNHLNHIAKEMPIMQPVINGESFYIRYNKFTFIKFVDSPKQIYREYKLNKLLR
jgi:hypothetical protein